MVRKNQPRRERNQAVHELAIARSLIDIVQEEAGRHGLVKVVVIRLQIGVLAGVVPESLTFCFEMVSQDTLAAGAAIEIETVPLIARCSRCNVEFQVDDNIFLCPECGDPSIKLVSGRDLSIVNIEGETGEEDGSGECPSGAEHLAGK